MLVKLTVDILLDTGKVNGLDTTGLLLHGARQSRTSDGSSRTSGRAHGSDKSASLRSRLGHLAGHRPHGLGESSGRHFGWLGEGRKVGMGGKEGKEGIAGKDDGEKLGRIRAPVRGSSNIFVSIASENRSASLWRVNCGARIVGTYRGCGPRESGE